MIEEETAPIRTEVKRLSGEVATLRDEIVARLPKRSG